MDDNIKIEKHNGICACLAFFYDLMNHVCKTSHEKNKLRLPSNLLIHAPPIVWIKKVYANRIIVPR